MGNSSSRSALKAQILPQELILKGAQAPPLHPMLLNQLSVATLHIVYNHAKLLAMPPSFKIPFPYGNQGAFIIVSHQ